MVHAYQKGRLKHAPAKVRRIARHISEEDAEHFAKTKHDGLPERVEKKKKDDWDGEEKAASASVKVTVTVGRKSFTFPSKKAAQIYLQALPTITTEEARKALSENASGVKSVRLSYSQS